MPSRSIEVTSSSPAPSSTARTAQSIGVEPRRLPAALDDDLEPDGSVASTATPPGVDGDDHGLAAEPRRARGHQRRIGDRRACSGDLVRAGPQDVAHLVDAPDAAADRQRDERPPRRPLDDVEERADRPSGAAVMSRNTISSAPSRGVPLGELGGIALVDEVDEAGALDHAAVRDVEAGDDAARGASGRATARRRGRDAGTHVARAGAARRRPNVPGGTGSRAGGRGRTPRGTAGRAPSR